MPANDADQNLSTESAAPLRSSMQRAWQRSDAPGRSPVTVIGALAPGSKNDDDVHSFRSQREKEKGEKFGARLENDSSRWVWGGSGSSGGWGSGGSGCSGAQTN